MRLNRKAAVLAGLLAAIAVTALLIHHFASAKQAPAFRFATVERGDLQALVSATGTLNAVTTVSVGTQVSGQVSTLLVDFNDHVKKGQLLARIDPTIAQQGVAARRRISRSYRRRQTRPRAIRLAAGSSRRAASSRPASSSWATRHCRSHRPARDQAASLSRGPSRTSPTPPSTRPSTASSSSATSTSDRRSRPVSPLRSSS
jgi:multidrug efflux pump subunit AcrA (membrane-fusion protein)